MIKLTKEEFEKREKLSFAFMRGLYVIHFVMIALALYFFIRSGAGFRYSHSAVFLDILIGTVISFGATMFGIVHDVDSLQIRTSDTIGLFGPYGPSPKSIVNNSIKFINSRIFNIMLCTTILSMLISIFYLILQVAFAYDDLVLGICTTIAIIVMVANMIKMIRKFNSYKNMYRNQIKAIMNTIYGKSKSGKE